MHPALETEYRNIFRQKELIPLISQWVELNQLNQEATCTLLLHPNPPRRQQELNLLRHLNRRIQLCQEIIDKKNSSWHQQKPET